MDATKLLRDSLNPIICLEEALRKENINFVFKHPVYYDDKTSKLLAWDRQPFEWQLFLEEYDTEGSLVKRTPLSQCSAEIIPYYTAKLEPFLGRLLNHYDIIKKERERVAWIKANTNS